MTVSYLRRKDATTLIARDENGEFEITDGDNLDMGGGIVIAVMGPSQIGGGSVKACAGVVLAVFVGLVLAAVNGFGKGS